MKQTSSIPSLAGSKTWFAFALVAAAVVAVGLYAAGLYGRGTAIDGLLAQGRTDANLKVALLRAVMERPRALPVLLAEDQQVLAALENDDHSLVDALDGKLEGLVGDTSASVLYVTRKDGVAIASSNWRGPLSFVGINYSFREYFRRAMEAGAAEHFALGTVSKRPGLYISRRAETAGGKLGVVVVKMEFDQLESDWRETGRPAYVTDISGVVLITSVPSWRFMAAAPIPPDRLAAIRDSLQFGNAPLVPLPITQIETLSDDAAIVSAILPGTSAAEYLRLRTPVPTTSWQLGYLLPIEAPVAAAMREARLLALSLLVPVLALIAFLMLRRRAIATRIARAQAAREELERRVVERTADLSLARDRLQAEIADHRSTDAKLQVVQQDLVHANRLAILGQVAAGVAHEINQPVATIRAYAENARVFLSRGQQTPADENLTEIAALTERIGTITEDLKALGRKGRTPPEAVDLHGAIDGAIVLLKSRFAGRLEALTVKAPRPGLAVTANRVRLEQVLINLFQNALEALEGRSDARVDVSAEECGDEVVIRVADNGPGIPASIRGSLFTPFNTSKEKGLGLGLAIVKDIVADYGGHIEVDSSDGGTSFLIHLRKVTP
ncbi:ATP-binding protein [Rhizobium sp. RAF56]|uniref:ATP-binding protein n=1 Tax=Rhizobium sp. RAF56 TaxID=3233062 RepID=UPI003F964763